MTIGKGADQIDLYYFGRAHTGGDAFVVFPALRTMHAGDAFHTRDLPIMDKNNGGSGIAFPATLARRRRCRTSTRSSTATTRPRRRRPT